MDDHRTNRGGSRNSWHWAALVVCLLAAYVAGYIFGASGSVSHGQVNHGKVRIARIYKSSAVARMFVPAAWIESKITRRLTGVRSADFDAIPPGGTILWDFEYEADPDP